MARLRAELSQTDNDSIFGLLFTKNYTHHENTKLGNREIDPARFMFAPAS
jgi:hypothetical protein